jgi:hypothetical protein
MKSYNLVRPHKRSEAYGHHVHVRNYHITRSHNKEDITNPRRREYLTFHVRQIVSYKYRPRKIMFSVRRACLIKGQYVT